MPSDACCRSVPGRCCGPSALSAAFGGLWSIVDDQMPLSVLSAKVREQ